MKKILSTCGLFLISFLMRSQCPTATLVPFTSTITCNGAAATFTAVYSPTPNVTYQWLNPGGSVASTGAGSPAIFSVASPGTYSFLVTDNTSSCTVTQTFAVLSGTTTPSITVNAISGQTINCNNPCLQFNTQASIGPAPPSYSWVNTTTNATTTPVNGGYTVCVPGQYIAAFMDGNMCKVSQTITVMIDTVKPIVTATTNLSANSFTLNCYTPSLIATGLTNPMLPASNYSWTTPPSISVASNTISVALVNITSSPTSYTVHAKGTNGCVGRQKISFYKDILVPTYGILFTPTAITCSNPNVALTPDYISGPATAANFTFTSPPPTQTATSSGALFGIPGTYTLTVQLLGNGCITTSTNVLQQNIAPPSYSAVPDFTMCGSPTVNITPGTSGTAPNNYSWIGPPGAVISNTNSFSPSVNMAGTYTVFIIDTTNACSATNTVGVALCTGLENEISAINQISLWPNPSKGVFNVRIPADFSAAEIILTDVLGKEVKRDKLEYEINTVDCSKLVRGIYYYEVTHPEKNKKGKILIE
jgi:hypothetical protein